MSNAILNNVVPYKNIIPTREEVECVRKRFKAVLDILFNGDEYTLEENTQWKDLLADQICFKCRFPLRSWRDEKTKARIKLTGINIYVYHKVVCDKTDLSKKYKYFTLSIDAIGFICSYRHKKWYPPIFHGHTYDYQISINELDFSSVIDLFKPGMLS